VQRFLFSRGCTQKKGNRGESKAGNKIEPGNGINLEAGKCKDG